MTAQDGARDSFHPLPLFLTRPWRSEKIARSHVNAVDRNPIGMHRKGPVALSQHRQRVDPPTHRRRWPTPKTTGGHHFSDEYAASTSPPR